MDGRLPCIVLNARCVNLESRGCAWQAIVLSGGAKMKWLLAVGGLLLVSAVPAQAQMGGVGSMGHVTFRGLTSYPATQFNAVVVSGTANTYVPTTFASYDQAL